MKKMVLATMLLLSAVGCSQQAPGGQSASAEATPPAAPVELTISAAASLTDAMKELQASYEKSHANVKLVFNFGASGTLQQQIEQGAPSDLFISAGKKQMTTLVDKQLVDSSKQKNLLTNDLVAVVPKDSTLAMSSMQDLTGAGVKKIAIGEPETVPAGGYTKDSLTYFKLWDALQSKAVFAKDVRQVLSYVDTGNTEVGFVYKTDAMTSQKVKVAFAVDAKSYTPIEYPAGVVKATKHGKEADEFYTYLQGKDAQAVFVKYGFSLAAGK